MTGNEQPTTMCAAFQRTAAIDPDAVAVRTVGGTRTLTWRQYADQVRAVAAGLSALGVARGDTVALMMTNRVEFYPLEVGAQHVGATSFSVYNTLPANQLGHVLSNAGAKVMICEAQYVDRIRASEVPIEHIVCVDDAPTGTVSVEELIAAGSPEFDFEATWQAVRPEDIVTLIYTSGTTGNPKGVEIGHASLLFQADAVAEVLPVRFGDRVASYLPSAHITDRLIGLYAQEAHGTQITVVPDIKQFAAALPDCRPTICIVVPRVFEKLKAGLEFAVAYEPGETRRQALQWAMSVAAKVAAARLADEPVPEDVAVEWANADELVLSKLRTTLGFDQLEWILSGAAPIPPETLAFFGSLGVPISEVWGMSELCGLGTAVSPDQHKLGTVGKLLPGMEGRIAADGELLIRSLQVMVGYRGEPDKTAEAIDADGWLHTGDVMTMDDEGYLRIVDRKKELIINATGKNMSPANIENTIKAATPVIGDVVAIGDGRSYNTALIVLNADTAASYARQHGLPDAAAQTLAANADLIAQIKAGVAIGNAKLSRVEQIKRFIVLPAFWGPGGDELTLTQKLRRKPIAEKYATEIEALYARSPGPTVHEATAEPNAATCSASST